MTPSPSQRLHELGLDAAGRARARRRLRAGGAHRQLRVDRRAAAVRRRRLPVTGKVGDGDGLVPPDVAYQQARVAVLNALAAVAEQAGSLDRVARVVKLIGFVASDPSFTGQPQVVNGASELVGQVFGPAGMHARTAVGVAVLPLDAPVEVELVVELG